MSTVGAKLVYKDLIVKFLIEDVANFRFSAGIQTPITDSCAAKRESFDYL